MEREPLWDQETEINTQARLHSEKCKEMMYRTCYSHDQLAPAGRDNGWGVDSIAHRILAPEDPQAGKTAMQRLCLWGTERVAGLHLSRKITCVIVSQYRKNIREA